MTTRNVEPSDSNHSTLSYMEPHSESKYTVLRPRGKVRTLRFAGYIEDLKRPEGTALNHYSSAAALIDKRTNLTEPSSLKRGRSKPRQKQRVSRTILASPQSKGQSVAPSELSSFRAAQAELNRDFEFADNGGGLGDPKLPFRAETFRAPLVFLLAATNGNAELLEKFVEKQCVTTKDRKFLLNSEDEFGRSAIFYAVHKRILLCVA